MGAGLLARRFVCIGPGGLRLQPPAPRAGWRGGGRTGAQSALALAEQGTGEGGQEAGGSGAAGGGCINREGGTCILGWVRGGARDKESGKFAALGGPGQGFGCARAGPGAPGAPQAELAVSFFFLQAEGGCCWYRPLLLLPPGVKVQEEVQPLPSFLRSEHTEPRAAAPPLRRRLRSARERARPTAAAARPLQPSLPTPPAKLRDPARAAAPVRAPPPP